MLVHGMKTQQAGIALGRDSDAFVERGIKPLARLVELTPKMFDAHAPIHAADPVKRVVEHFAACDQPEIFSVEVRPPFRPLQ